MSDFAFKSLGPLLHILALLILFAMVAVGIALAIYLAGLPGRIAARRDNPQASAINICGWLGFPTGILWVVAMVWAFVRPAADAVTTSGVSSVSITRLATQIGELEEVVAILEQSRVGNVS